MPSSLVAGLSAPIREVQALVGPGFSGATDGHPAAVLAGLRDALAGVAADIHRSWSDTAPQWTGAAAANAARFMASAAASADGLAVRTATLGEGTDRAAAAIDRAGTRLRAIVDAFEARADALEPHLDTPGVAEELLSEAQHALNEAVSVVDELRAELDGHAAMFGAPRTSAAPSAPTVPAGFSGTPGYSGPSGSDGFGGFGGSGGFGTPAGLSGLGTGHSGAGLAELAGLSTPEAPTTWADAGLFGDGLAVRLPDGSTAQAPNAVAASAVRHALTQLGVPYQWGGTAPGVGLDCSGLTQWAYHEAGLDLPRLAQEQDVGAAVDPGSLRPGDLAVWDGHVAMVVGDGQMIEAGDPVQLSPIRTTNAGQGFHGFFRPTA